MNKTEILKMIEEQKDAQKKATELIGALIKLPNVGADAVMIASILGTINATVFDTMTTLSLILCDMLLEEENYNE